jgi:hypothetical protein
MGWMQNQGHTKPWCFCCNVEKPFNPTNHNFQKN